MEASRKPARLGSISARAEEPSSRPSSETACRVDLRAGGGAWHRKGDYSLAWGRSPRGRRSLVDDLLVGDALGSISARAEEPR